MGNARKGSVTNGTQQIPTLGEFAQQVINDPEHLHQMRVGTRRLRTALQVFESAVQLPRTANAKQLRNLARVLGQVRDLDVQTASLKQEYYPPLNPREQKKLKHVSKILLDRRETAVDHMKTVLNNEFERLQKTYKTWIKTPQLTSIATLPLTSALPAVLSPLLSKLFLHAGWLIPIDGITDDNAEVLHDLRKLCKHVRYQTEFFVPFYGEEFGEWVKEIKQIQDDLGAFQDTQILQALLTEELGQKPEMPELQSMIRQKQADALKTWEEVRCKYLDDGFRYHLYEILLQPTVRSSKVHPELVGAKPGFSNS
jgi:CHAD domain-containing protein